MSGRRSPYRFLLMAVVITLVAACGGQKPAPAAAKADTTAACCDSATLAKCRADSTGSGYGPCGTSAPADTTGGKASPAQCGS